MKFSSDGPANMSISLANTKYPSQTNQRDDRGHSAWRQSA